jgi:DnaK suppressor protein
MRKAFLKKARETLQEMRAQLLRNVQQDLSEVRDQSKDEGMDTYDLASDAWDKEINLILGDRDREKVQAIDEALGRTTTAARYLRAARGRSPRRLQALPFTRLCVNCQADRERELKMNRRFEEDRSFRRISSSDGEEDNS